MAEGGSSKYGRLFTEADMLGLLRFGINRGFDLITKPGMADLTLEQVVREYDAEHGLTFPADEPLFLLRGQDKAAPDTIRTLTVPGTLDYFTAAYEAGADLPHLDTIKVAGVQMREWQAANPARVKIPD